MRRLLLVAAAAIVVGVPAVLVARWLQADTTERDKVVRLLSAQARGDGDAMAAELGRCDPACRRALARQASSLAREGKLEIVRYDSATAHALGADRGSVRVVWRIRDRTLPTVQCVDVRRTGSALSGPRVTLLGLSAPIGREESC